MLTKFVVSPQGLALDRFLVRWLGISLTTQVFARANGYKPGPALYLETIGRKSGKPRGVALPYFRFDGAILLVASRGGAPTDPFWALNLREHPDCIAYINRKRSAVRARFTSGEEREQYWSRLKATVPSYAQYEGLTIRQIPVIVLESR